MRKTLFTALALSALALPALAQSTPPAAAPGFVSVGENSMLTSRLIGLDVVNAANQAIGEIKDVVLGPDGATEGYILSVGGFLGMGDHYVVVNPASVAISYDAGEQKWHASMNTTEDQLKAAPVFKYEGRWKS